MEESAPLFLEVVQPFQKTSVAAFVIVSEIVDPLDSFLQWLPLLIMPLINNYKCIFYDTIYLR